ncbi:hypothetical protein DRN73_07690 [Candidatus Pacearchaeota archaeon]|nr:MAG: hypothetical protein DRN73_07690 [Candidatus Pacearchaeota archaeon]
MVRNVKVKFGIRKGEYGPSARIEFPHPAYIHAILENTSFEEQKKYKFHYFNNILVAKNYTNDLKKFLQEGARKLGIELEFINDVKK